MGIIISKNGKNARKIEQTTVKEEDFLQRYVAANPESLPLDSIRDDLKLMVIGREFATQSGPVDVLAIDDEGGLYIVETKLYKNPDKRLVIAQLLDYGAALWKAYPTGDDFLADLEQMLALDGENLSKRLSAFFGLSDLEVEEIRAAVKQNLADGNLKFIVLMDRVHDRLRDLILFINQKSRFNVYAVEMEFYEHDGMEIVIPRLLGAEVKKDVSSNSATRRGKLASEAEFFHRIDKESVKDTFRKLLEFSTTVGALRDFGSTSISLKLPDPKGTRQKVTLFVIDTYGEVYLGWTATQLEALKLPTKLSTEYVKSIAALVPGVEPDPRYGDSLSRTLTAAEVRLVFDSFTRAVKSFVENVKKASRG